MPKQVSLRDATYARLRALRRNDDSFSDVIDRLIDQGRPKKDPWRFVHRRRNMIWSAEEHLRLIEQWRDEDRI